MDYLLIKLAWYAAAAFGLGLVVGFASCSRRKT
jgi:hypothetical protein